MKGIEEHEERARILGEVHARPFRLMESGRVVLHLAFLVDDAARETDRCCVERLSVQNGQAGPGTNRHHEIKLSNGTLRWEAHSEFVTYSWDGGVPFASIERLGHPFGSMFQASGKLIAATRVDLSIENTECEIAIDRLDRPSLCNSQVHGGQAEIATDFRQDRDGFTHIIVKDKGLDAARAGSLVQRLLEIDTYRVLALMGLPEAQRAAVDVTEIEQALVRVTAEMKSTGGFEDNNRLLTELTALAARLEAVAVAGLYRFGASRAYNEIVHLRLQAVDEVVLPEFETWASFLDRRMTPAMRTCRSVEERQSNLSTKLARAATLLRTRVDVEAQNQNRELLESMNRRARLQLRLQRTVEGLSIAAVSYYVVGLVAYMLKGGKGFGLMIDPATITSISVPIVVVSVALIVRQIRNHHSDVDG